MVSFWKHIQLCICMLLVSLLALASLPAAADLGDRVTNIATVSHDSDTGRVEFQTNEAAFTVEARPTPSEIEFFRIALSAPDAFPVTLNGADYSPSGELNGPYVPVDNVTAPGGEQLSKPTLTKLIPATTYLSGEVIIVRVVDEGQNGDPSAIETVNITVMADNGDAITLRLYEDTPDSGAFYAFFPSATRATPKYNQVLTAPADTKLTARYEDIFDATEVSVDTAFVDPFGRVFDSYTGQLLDDVRVSIVDVRTGQPAQVYGVDGVGDYPASVRTGQSTVDSIGLEYSVTDGAFLYPILPPGTYRIDVDAPEGYVFPSSRAADAFGDLPNSPFEPDPRGSYNQVFTMSKSDVVSIDIPLDPNGDLIVVKEAAQETAAIGDLLGYVIHLTNSGQVPAPFSLQDSLPEGLRYVANSVRRDGAGTSEPVISADGQKLTFTGGLVMPGQSVTLSYLTSIGPGTPLGEITNRALATNRNGEPISNQAEAVVIIQEDLFQNIVTIAGRVAEAACEPEADWARDIQHGAGVAGVRLYMEDGRYVVTDEDGLFHFEAVTPGTHVVQLDVATLPKGYVPVICEENSRYAGSAISKFVDAQGGSLWRANFYLKRTEAVPKASEETDGAELSDQADYGAKWLEAQTDAAPVWVYPVDDETPSGRSVALGVRHAPTQQVEMRLNGRPVPGLNFEARNTNAARSVAISRWTGVDIQRGENQFVAILRDLEGQIVTELKKTVWFVDEVDRAHLMPDQSILVANGRERPVIAIRLEDGSGHPVHEGRIVDISVSEPYRLASEAEEEFEAPVTAALSAVSGTRVGQNGLALVELEPTLQSGRVRLQVQLSSGRLESVDVWLKPEKREWVLVGLAEAEGLLSNTGGEAGRQLDERMADGRLAFFAKGTVRGDWLMTVAYDTAKRRGRNADELFDEIDPNAYYTLYGDRTWQHNDAESQYPLYVKLERDSFKALFGDYETDLTDTELGRYTRRLSGLKVGYESETYSLNAFASETDQRFVKDELPADGTSGPFRLSAAQIVRASETITIETRRRFRPDQVEALTPLNRYIDYEIDYATGELFFRQPIPATDSNFNPNVIVIDYETDGPGEAGVLAGGRAALRLAEGAVETGLTFLHEADESSARTGDAVLVGLDTTIKLGATELRAEFAASETGGGETEQSGEAWLVEAIHRTDRVSALAYYREESAGFGLGQQSSSTSALRRVGAEISAELSAQERANGNDRSVRTLEGRAYREENLSNRTRRDVVEVALAQESQALGGSLGLRAASEDFGETSAPRQSVLVTMGARKTFPAIGLSLSATHEEPLWGGGANDDEVTLFPARTMLGIDKSIGQRATLNLRHEMTNGADASGDTTIAGISWEPLSGMQLRAATDMMTRDSARRIGATVGVDQTLQLSKAWSVGLGLARRANIEGGETPLDVTADGAISPLEDGVRSPLAESGSYTSAYFGAGYRADTTAVSARVEVRDSALSERLMAVAGGAREVSETLSFSAAARYETESLTEGQSREVVDVRIGASWRPDGDGLILLNRFDVGHVDQSEQGTRSRIVNNLAANLMMSERTQLSVYHGLKHVETEYFGAKAKGWTQLAGAEIRHDLTKRIDLGLQATWSSGELSQTSAWSVGPSIGFTPKQNVWVSVGYNISGFEDEDFEAARYTRQGPFLKVRAKFDQDTVKGLIKGLGLGAD